jgi:hypothetical protein
MPKSPRAAVYHYTNAEEFMADIIAEGKKLNAGEESDPPASSKT